MSSPRYPTRQEARSLLDKLRNISKGKIAGASLLALAALAPRCGGAAYHMKPYEQYDMETDDRRAPVDLNRAQPDRTRPPADAPTREASGADGSAADGQPDESSD